MPNFLIQVAYTPGAWQTLINNPQNRIEAVRPAIEKLGGKITNSFFSFGEYDVILLTEFADNVSAAAIAMAFAAGGACKSVKTTPLLTTAEALDAMKKAGTSGYRPASAAATAAR